MDRLPWIIKLPPNTSGSIGTYSIRVAPTFQQVSRIEVTSWQISSSVLPPEVKIEFAGDVGNRKTAYYSLGVLNGSANPISSINNGLLFAPNQQIGVTYDSHDYNTPIVLCDLGTLDLGGFDIRVTDFSGAACTYDGFIVVTLQVYVDSEKHRYKTDPTPAQKRALDGYYITDGRRPRQSRN